MKDEGRGRISRGGQSFLFILHPSSFPHSTNSPGRAKFGFMEIATQLALFLANQPGALANVCDALAKAEINILALTISDTVDHAVVRMIVSDTDLALSIFEEHGTLVIENEVLLIEIDNQPGKLAAIAHRLAEVEINIEYAYLATGHSAQPGLMVLRASDVNGALEALQPR
jgi:hypothetical protein